MNHAVCVETPSFSAILLPGTWSMKSETYLLRTAWSSLVLAGTDPVRRWQRTLPHPLHLDLWVPAAVCPHLTKAVPSQTEHLHPVSSAAHLRSSLPRRRSPR